MGDSIRQSESEHRQSPSNQMKTLIVLTIVVVLVVLANALPQRSNVSVCKSENKQKCSDLFKGKKPTKSECNGCEQCTKCGGVGFLKTFLGSTKFVKDIETKCSYCDGGVLACKQNCIANIDNCLACF